jgi:hypothetical protein
MLIPQFIGAPTAMQAFPRWPPEHAVDFIRQNAGARFRSATGRNQMVSPARPSQDPKLPLSPAAL